MTILNLKIKPKSENKWKFVIKRGVKFLMKEFAQSNPNGFGEKFSEEKAFY